MKRRSNGEAERTIKPGNHRQRTTITIMAPEIPQKMKAIQIVDFNKPYEIREVDTPTNLDPSGKHELGGERKLECQSNGV